MERNMIMSGTNRREPEDRIESIDSTRAHTSVAEQDFQQRNKIKHSAQLTNRQAGQCAKGPTHHSCTLHDPFRLASNQLSRSDDAS